jgi:phosphatidylserine/phosphatidylglycerophosphate/cardiolipin synthase-like enzyme
MKTQFVTPGYLEIAHCVRKGRPQAGAGRGRLFWSGREQAAALGRGSRLVVDASENAVKSGQTHPADLKKLQNRGVVIYSYPSLHAKVYAFDGFAFVGSANASNRSSGILTEAVVKTSDQAVDRRKRSSAISAGTNSVRGG